MPETDDTLRGVLLPLAEESLLVPSPVVVEVTGFSEPEADDRWPSWVLGVFRWRRQLLPLVSMEKALGWERPPRQSRRKRIVILRTLDRHPELPCYGLLVRGTPRVVPLFRGALYPSHSTTVSETFVRQRVDLFDTETAIIPDLEALQGSLLAACAPPKH